MKLKKEVLINDKELISLGFKRSRFYCEHFEAFRLKYTIEGMDDDIILKSYTSIGGYKTPYDQIERYSNIQALIYWSQPPYQVYCGSGHVTTISSKSQLKALIKVLEIEVNTK